MSRAAALAAVAALAFLISVVGTRALIPVLRRRGIVDRPNRRSSHSQPTPRGGGVAPVAAVLVAWAGLTAVHRAPPALGLVLLGAVLLMAVSWIDDLRGLPPLPRLLAQAAAVALAMIALPPQARVFQGWLSGPVDRAAAALLWIWWVNLFNFMDGIDGLAGSEAAAIGLGLVLVSALADAAAPGLLAAALAGATLAFLVWNWAPARVFLGDVGSIPLGYLSGFLLLDLAVRRGWAAALILPLYFLADATLTLARRLSRGEPVWQAHREHFYQRAVQRGLGHADVVRRVIAADVLLILCGATAAKGWSFAALAAAVAIVAVLLAVLARGRPAVRVG
jgi:UDP-N-acetylmuramyl pentapeptide phosphotransferase/UDP-N-acetylglucosamine-1-phosphate transferase